MLYVHLDELISSGLLQVVCTHVRTICSYVKLLSGARTVKLGNLENAGDIALSRLDS
jgi:hypothetical protein